MSSYFKKTGVPSSELETAIDKLAFIPNKCSSKAKKIISINHKFVIDLWFDKHYFDRHKYGDDNGKREGIAPAIVESLVTRAIGHLFMYSATANGFKFTNYMGAAEPAGRMVLQDVYNDSISNVVIEVHLLNANHFEVTVKTAMCVDNFRIGMGQYVIEMQDDSSVLKKNNNGKIVTILNL